MDAAQAGRRRPAERIATVARDFGRRPFTARVNVTAGRSSAPTAAQRPAASAAQADAEEAVADLIFLGKSAC